MSLPSNPTHAQLAGKLLVDAATFFDTIAKENPPLKEQMAENASVFRAVSALLVGDPGGTVEDTPHGELAGKFLGDAAAFFRTIGAQNEGLKDQMDENASVFEQVAGLVRSDPTGRLDGRAPTDVFGAFNRARS